MGGGGSGGGDGDGVDADDWSGTDVDELRRLVGDRMDALLTREDDDDVNGDVFAPTRRRPLGERIAELIARLNARPPPPRQEGRRPAQDGRRPDEEHEQVRYQACVG